MCTLDWVYNDPYNQVYASVLVILGFMVPFLTTICVYASMFQAARDNSERARKHSVNSTTVETNLPDSQAKPGGVPQKKKCRRWSSGSNQFFGEEWKAVRTALASLTRIFYVFRNKKTSRKHVKQLLCPSNLNKNKRWIFHQVSKDKENQSGVNPCILTASLETNGSEKVKALPSLYQDIEGNWQVFSTSEEHSRKSLMKLRPTYLTTISLKVG
ncbi:melanopsin [Caerostris extrusa]|uniref:Melanopsin n=1 Tax=Caerostris extrusa TaxID=172846 RepID=A0AAV4Y3R1_CAEEX|nr:melanopsin [Caerostris extrusa]